MVTGCSGKYLCLYYLSVLDIGFCGLEDGILLWGGIRKISSWSWKYQPLSDPFLPILVTLPLLS